MRSALLALLLSATAAAQTLPPCPDNWESSSPRRIRALQGTVVPVAQVPRELRERAEGFWRADFVSRGSDFPEPATGVHVKDARVYQFPHATFYLLRVNDVTTLVSAKCSWRCSSLWWDGEFTLLANADKPPAGVPGDEFYLRRPTLHAGQAVLVHADGDHALPPGPVRAHGEHDLSSARHVRAGRPAQPRERHVLVL